MFTKLSSAVRSNKLWKTFSYFFSAIFYCYFSNFACSRTKRTYSRKSFGAVKVFALEFYGLLGSGFTSNKLLFPDDFLFVRWSSFSSSFISLIILRLAGVLGCFWTFTVRTTITPLSLLYFRLSSSTSSVLFSLSFYRDWDYASRLYLLSFIFKTCYF